MRRALALWLALAPAAAAQEITETPRMLETTAGIAGYEDLQPERFGTPATPRPDEMGAILLLRIFRNTCLAAEAGAPPEAVLPSGFAAYGARAYLFGTPGPRTPTTYLSATGDILRDEEEGHPSIALGESCRIDWRLPTPPGEETARHMRYILTEHFPYIFALTRASRPEPSQPPGIATFIEWDRPCHGQWCPTSLIFDPSGGQITLTTRLNRSPRP
ncbi:hypothetical protein [Vannielia litorea]|uniref:hypothetical protein n=1 Tax=Vannielia litorea TaxID=1217970 RepID=UPI001BCE7F28|nr:hypothetical protein [Vannielia litorea]MBS8227655.1 hypothetical protein [Vannielia litorea]